MDPFEVFRSFFGGGDPFRDLHSSFMHHSATDPFDSLVCIFPQYLFSFHAVANVRIDMLLIILVIKWSSSLLLL